MSASASSSTGAVRSEAERRVDLVFEGGGVKGIALAGAYRELSDRGYEPQCVAGTSAGAITAALVAVGYTGAELEQTVLHEMRFTEFADPTFLDHLGLAGSAAQFLLSRGMHSGKHFLSWMQERLRAKGATTFGDLRDPGQTNQNRSYRLQVIASDLSGRRMLILPRDAALIGIDPDQLEIAEAVRMSMSIPIFFEPVTVEHRATGVRHVIVDGGLLSNYPVWLFDSAPGTPPRFPTFGMLLVAPGQQTPLLPASAPGAQEGAPIGSDVGFLKAIGETMMQAHDRFYVEQANYARTIPIPTLGVGTTEFDIAPDRAAALFESGREAAADFLAGWDFATYMTRFRVAAPPGRRATVRRPLARE